MRFVAAVLVLSSICAVASAQGTSSTTTHTTTHRPTAHVPRLTVPDDPKATEGLIAVGSMPAATGPSTPLYTLRSVDLKLGTGELARTSAPGAVVFYTVHYTGWLTDGTKFDSSVDRNEPFVFPQGLKRVITAWDTGFEGMRVGGKRRLIVPYQLAYGAIGHPPEIPAKADMIFDVELLGQGDTPQPVLPKAADAPAIAAPQVQPAPSSPTPPSRPEEHQE